MNTIKNNHVDISNYSNVIDIIEEAFTKYPDKPAFTCIGQTYTFAQIDEKSSALANYLQHECKFEVGDRIAIQLPNLIQFPIAAYAALKCGLVLVNTNPLYTEREMRHQFSDSGCKGIIILGDLLPKLESIISDTLIEKVVVTNPVDLLNPAGKYQGKYVSFVDAIEQGQSLSKYIKPSTALSDLSVLQYTGGTTGLSKGAMLSHANLLANAQQSYDRFSHVSEDGKDIYVSPLPLYHIYAFLVNLLLAASHGIHNVLIPNPRDLDAFIAAIKPFKFTTFTGINTLFVGLCHHPEFKTLDFSALKFTVSGGTALTSSAAELWKSVTGCMISEGYGLSETSPVLTFNTPGKEKLGTIGWPVVDTDIQIWDDENNVLPQGEAGEIVAKGPQVMSGYWKNSDATAQSIINGYFKTGDVGVIHSDGRIQIVDRKKDMIIVSGFNVYPNEIEDVLSQHTNIVEAAVIGKPDEHSGERVCAYIVKIPESILSEDDVAKHCKELLTGYKVPKEIHFIDELPKSTVGKVLRRELR